MKLINKKVNNLNVDDYDLVHIIHTHTLKKIDGLNSIQSVELTVSNNSITSTYSMNPRRTVIETYLDESLNNRDINMLAKKISKDITAEKPKTLAIFFTGTEIKEADIQYLKRLLLSQNDFSKYKNKTSSNYEIKTADLFTLHNDEEALNNEATLLSESIAFAQDLVNEPANIMTPTKLSQLTKKMAIDQGIDVEILNFSEIEELNMKAFLEVARGSNEDPKFIILRYLNNPKSDETIGLVGKGVTYDSGGYAIKSAKGMVNMHCDMGGGAAVIGAMNLLAAREDQVNAIAVVAACENMISGDAFKNGDIIPSMSGKYIEVINTDAEGRLTMADAIHYIHTNEKVDRIVDIATLTGAVRSALGTQITGVVSDDDFFYNQLQLSAEKSGDKIWRLPCDDDLSKCNESKRADIKNSSTCGAGTTTAGLFLRSFANGIPWTHLDIAFTAYQSENEFNPEGASGVGVELLANGITNFFKNQNVK